MRDLFEIEPSPMQLLIQGCKRNDRESQRLLYQHYYGYALSVCFRYCRTMEEAKEVVNDGFLKVFGKINQFKSTTSFKAWLRRIMVNTSIDQIRRERKNYFMISIQDSVEIENGEVSILDDLTHKELVELVQNLSPAYRAVFNLYVIDGYTHKEIGEMLEISEGTSKSNLLKARRKLRNELSKLTERVYAKSI